VSIAVSTGANLRIRQRACGLPRWGRFRAWAASLWAASRVGLRVRALRAGGPSGAARAEELVFPFSRDFSNALVI